jgi:uncharacterized protein
VPAGQPPAWSVAGTGEQSRPTADVPPLVWYEAVWMRGRRGPAAPMQARLLAGAGLAALFGWLGYLAFLQTARGPTIDPGPLLAGRPLPWPALQALAVVALVVLGVRQRRGGNGGDRVRTAVLRATGTVFVPWAVYWGLLLP